MLKSPIESVLWVVLCSESIVIALCKNGEILVAALRQTCKERKCDSGGRLLLPLFPDSRLCASESSHTAKEAIRAHTLWNSSSLCSSTYQIQFRKSQSNDPSQTPSHSQKAHLERSFRYANYPMHFYLLAIEHRLDPFFVLCSKILIPILLCACHTANWVFARSKGEEEIDFKLENCVFLEFLQYFSIGLH